MTKRKPTEDYLISEQDAAEYLGVSKWTVRRLRDQGHMPWVMVGGQVRIARSELDRYVSDRTRRA